MEVPEVQVAEGRDGEAQEDWGNREMAPSIESTRPSVPVSPPHLTAPAPHGHRPWGSPGPHEMIAPFPLWWNRGPPVL